MMVSFRKPASRDAYPAETVNLGVRNVSFKEALRHAHELSLLQGEITIHNDRGEPFALVTRHTINQEIGVRILIDLKVLPDGFEELTHEGH